MRKTLRFTLEIVKLITTTKTLIAPDVGNLNDAPLKLPKRIRSKSIGWYKIDKPPSFICFKTQCEFEILLFNHFYNLLFVLQYPS